MYIQDCFVLNDIAGGASLLTKWKVALAATILGLSVGTLTGCEPMTTCYDPAMPAEQQETGTEQESGNDPDIMCYAPALLPDENIEE